MGLGKRGLFFSLYGFLYFPKQVNKSLYIKEKNYRVSEPPQPCQPTVAIMFSTIMQSISVPQRFSYAQKLGPLQ